MVMEVLILERKRHSGAALDLVLSNRSWLLDTPYIETTAILVTPHDQGRSYFRGGS